MDNANEMQNLESFEGKTLGEYFIYDITGSQEKSLKLIGEISDSMLFENIIVPLKTLESLWSPEDKIPVKIWISSVGGDLTPALTLCSILDNITIPVELYVSTAYSAAFLISCSGRKNPMVKKVCNKYSSFMFHDVAGEAGGKFTNMDKTIKYFAKQREQVREYILNNTDISPSEYDLMLLDDDFMVASKALEYGVIDEII